MRPCRERTKPYRRLYGKMIDETQTDAAAKAIRLVHLENAHRIASGGLPQATLAITAAAEIISRKPEGSDGKRSVNARGRRDALPCRALGFVASDPELLPRFLAITGIEAQSIRQRRQRAGIPGRRPAVHPGARADAAALCRGDRHPAGLLSARRCGRCRLAATTMSIRYERRSRDGAPDRRTCSRRPAAAGPRRRRCRARIHPARFRIS